MNVVLAAVLAPAGVVIAAAIGWFGARAYQKALARKTDAETGRTHAETRRTNAESAKTEAESWQLLNGGLVARVAQLETENADLRRRLAEAEELARQCRLDLDELRNSMRPEVS